LRRYRASGANKWNRRGVLYFYKGTLARCFGLRHQRFWPRLCERDSGRHLSERRSTILECECHSEFKWHGDGNRSGLDSWECAIDAGLSLPEHFLRRYADQWRYDLCNHGQHLGPESGTVRAIRFSPAYTGYYLWVAGFTNTGNNSLTLAGFECAGATSSSLMLVNASGVTETPTLGTLLICGGTSPCANAVIGGNGQGVGYQALDLFAGQPVQMGSGAYNATSPYAPTNCTAFGYTGVQLISGNYIPNSIGPLATIGSTVWNGTWTQSNAQVTYPWTGPSPGTTDSTGN